MCNNSRLVILDADQSFASTNFIIGVFDFSLNQRYCLSSNGKNDATFDLIATVECKYLVKIIDDGETTTSNCCIVNKGLTDILKAVYSIFFLFF